MVVVTEQEQVIAPGQNGKLKETCLVFVIAKQCSHPTVIAYLIQLLPLLYNSGTRGKQPPQGLDTKS